MIDIGQTELDPCWKLVPCLKLYVMLCYVLQLKSTPKPDTVTEEQIGDLRNQVEQCQTELKTAQTEVDRLLEILKETENEKHDKDNQIKELQE